MKEPPSTPANSPKPFQKPRKHRWGDKVEFPLAHKSERVCLNGCGIVRASRNESEGGRPIYWTEYWRELDRIAIDRAPVCESIEVEV